MRRKEQDVGGKEQVRAAGCPVDEGAAGGAAGAECFPKAGTSSAQNTFFDCLLYQLGGVEAEAVSPAPSSSKGTPPAPPSSPVLGEKRTDVFFSYDGVVKSQPKGEKVSPGVNAAMKSCT